MMVDRGLTHLTDEVIPLTASHEFHVVLGGACSKDRSAAAHTDMRAECEFHPFFF